jgi:hypothetical protein
MAARKMVNGSLTSIVRSRETGAVYGCAMDTPFIHGRGAIEDAAELIARFGEDAMLEAAARAQRSRDDANVARFCHWRQIERVIATLASDEVCGTVH